MILHPGGFGPTVVAASGPIVGGGFNALAIARDACRQSRTIDAIIDRFMTQAEQPYRAMHDWLLRTESEYVHRRSSSVIEPIARTEVKSGSAFYSRARDLPRFVRQNRHWFQPSYARAAERLVEADIASGWVDVGPPIAVLQIDPTGARWFKQGLCPAIDPTLWPAD